MHYFFIRRGLKRKLADINKLQLNNATFKNTPEILNELAGLMRTCQSIGYSNLSKAGGIKFESEFVLAESFVPYVNNLAEFVNNPEPDFTHAKSGFSSELRTRTLYDWMSSSDGFILDYAAYITWFANALEIISNFFMYSCSEAELYYYSSRFNEHLEQLTAVAVALTKYKLGK